MLGTYSAPGSEDEWYRRGFDKAKEVIKNYPLLNELTDGFSSVEGKTEDETRNFIFLNSFPHVTEELFPEQIATLKEFEDALASIDVLKMGGRRLRELKAKMNDDDYDVGMSLFTEVILAKRLKDLYGRSAVEVYPELSNGKFSDVLLQAEGEDIYIEVGNLGNSLPESIIHRILNEGAKYAGERMKGEVYLKLEVDTAKLVFDEGRIDESASIRKLKQEIDALAPEQLGRFRGIINVGEMKEVLQSFDQLAQESLPRRQHQETVRGGCFSHAFQLDGQNTHRGTQ